MGGEKRYVYGVIESEPVEVAVDDVGGTNTIETGASRDHAAVVQDVDTIDSAQAEENLSAHDDGLTAVLTDGDGPTIVPTYQVNWSKQEAIGEAIDRIQDALDDVTVQYPGPCAPSDFVDIESGVEQ